MTDQENFNPDKVDEDIPEHDREADVIVDETVVDGRDYRVEGNDISGYLGVSLEYMTYANETEKPILTDQEKWDYTNQLDHLEGNIDEENVESVDPGDTVVDESKDDSSEVRKTDNQTVIAPVVPSVIK